MGQGAGIGRLRIIDRAVEHATEGEAVPYFYGGRQRGTYRRHDTRILLAALRVAERELKQRRGSSTTEND